MREPRGWAVQTLLVVCALLVGLVSSVGVVAGREVARAQDARKAELIELVTVRRDRVDTLERRAERFSEQVVRTQERAGTPVLRAAVEELQGHTGVAALVGPGLEVVLDDARPCRSDQPQDCRILDSDLQLAANALFAAGAEGVAVNDQRLIGTSAIRGAGLSILVNYRPLEPPYVLQAVGASDTLMAAFSDQPIAQRFAGWTEAYGLGFDVAEVDQVQLPAYRGTVRLRDADVVGADPGP